MWDAEVAEMDAVAEEWTGGVVQVPAQADADVDEVLERAEGAGAEDEVVDEIHNFRRHLIHTTAK